MTTLAEAGSPADQPGMIFGNLVVHERHGSKVAVATTLLPTIRLSGKLFFNHIHKASGTAFLEWLVGLDGVEDCSKFGIISGDHTNVMSWPLFHQWWADMSPRCNLASIEEPELGDLQAKLYPPGAAPGGYEPQMLSFYRHPVARCRSHWKYEQALCRRRPLGMHSDYCNGYFLPRFGGDKLHDTSAHEAFVTQYCTEIVSRSLTSANGIASPPQLLLQRLVFFGLQVRNSRLLPGLCSREHVHLLSHPLTLSPSHPLTLSPSHSHTRPLTLSPSGALSRVDLRLPLPGRPLPPRPLHVWWAERRRRWRKWRRRWRKRASRH